MAMTIFPHRRMYDESTLLRDDEAEAKGQTVYAFFKGERTPLQINAHGLGLLPDSVPTLWRIRDDFRRGEFHRPLLIHPQHSLFRNEAFVADLIAQKSPVSIFRPLIVPINLVIKYSYDKLELTRQRQLRPEGDLLANSTTYIWHFTNRYTP